MNFQELLKDYVNGLGCSQNELSHASGLSVSVISRYLSGERTPTADSAQLLSLVEGLAKLAKEKQMASDEWTTEHMLSEFALILEKKDKQYKHFRDAFSQLLDTFDISIKHLAQALNYDTTFLYRIRSGERRPSDLDAFCNKVASYVATHFTSDSDLPKAAALLLCDVSELSSKIDYEQKLLFYLNESAPIMEPTSNVSSFLTKMDEFDLDEFIEVIHFNDIKIPTTPFQLPVSKYYYGIADMRKAELTFFKTTVLSKSMEPIFMCADMPMVDMAEDMDFNKKWMFGIAASLKKGLQINIIHNLDRPFEELLLGLEAWIPIYMTGLVNPYHLEGYQNHVFHQLNYCSGAAALFGECIDGHHADGRYYLTTIKHDITYYRQKADDLLSHAKPLMDIYTEAKLTAFLQFVSHSVSSIRADRYVISPCLPLYTLPEDILTAFLADTAQDKKKQILDFCEKQKSAVAKLLNNHKIIFDYHVLTKEAFDACPPTISFPERFLPSIQAYDYEQYLRHVQATEALAAQNGNFIFNKVTASTFKNIKITIVSKHYFVVSKYKSPNIHFVIRHAKMLHAMENFYAIKQE